MICILVILSFLLQSTVFKQLELASVSPNLLLIVTAAIGVMRGEKEGVAVGFLCGILCDIMYGDVIGLYALLYSIIGYGNGIFKRIFYDEDIKLPLILIAISDLIYSHLVFVFLFVMRSKFGYITYLKNIIVPELIYTILVTLIFYQIILQINRKLEIEEKRSASKFV